MTIAESAAVRLAPLGVAKSNAVVVAYGDDRSGSVALRYAANEARLRQTQLQVVHQLVGREVPGRFSTVREYLSKRDRAAAHVRNAVRAVASDLTDIDIIITTDRIGDELLVASRQASLLVIGSATRHGTTAALIEGAEHEAVANAHCPVALVPDNEICVDPLVLVCGVDRSPESREALSWAADDATRRGIRVIALEVRSPWLPAAGETERPLLSKWVRDSVPDARTTIHCYSDAGRSAKRLLVETASRHGMLVVGRHRRSPWRHSVTRAVAAQSVVPVVLIPHEIASGSADDH